MKRRTTLIAMAALWALPTVARASGVQGSVGNGSGQWTTEQQNNFNDAMQHVAQQHPVFAQHIATSLGDGTVAFFDMENEIGKDFEYGRADSDTVAIDLDGGLTAAEIAAVIIHEWTHVVGFLDPAYGSQNEYCVEAEAYAAQLDALEAMSCDYEGTGEQPGCDEWERVSGAYQDTLTGCEDSGQTPPPPPSASNPQASEPSCGC